MAKEEEIPKTERRGGVVVQVTDLIRSTFKYPGPTYLYTRADEKPRRCRFTMLDDSRLLYIFAFTEEPARDNLREVGLTAEEVEQSIEAETKIGATTGDIEN